MIREYSYVVDDSVLEFFANCTKRDREQLMRVFLALADDPFQKGDLRAADPFRSGGASEALWELAHHLLAGRSRD
jgi:hypothetical protein